VQVAGFERQLRIAGRYFGDERLLKVAEFERCWQIVEFVGHSKVAERQSGFERQWTIAAR
jgi:hypothetical protein